jgi:hypothetical protein
MAEIIKNEYRVPFEPLKENRFIIKLDNVKIPNYFFREYEIYNEGEELIFTTSFFETVDYAFNPKNFFDITGVTIEYLDPIGEVVNGLKFDVKGSNFSRKQSYKNDELQINFLKFIINKNTMTLLYKNPHGGGEYEN